MQDNVQSRIKELIQILEEANYNYYVLANPTITKKWRKARVCL